MLIYCLAIYIMDTSDSPPPKKKNYEKVNYSIFFMKNDEKQCRYLFLKKYILIKNVIGYFYLRLSGSATITLAVSWCMT